MANTHGIVDLSLVEHWDTYSHGDADDAHRNGHNLEAPRREIKLRENQRTRQGRDLGSGGHSVAYRVLVEVDGPDARVPPRPGTSPSGQQRRHVGRGRSGREEAGVQRRERRGESGHGCGPAGSPAGAAVAVTR
jgi:hypothetical protein